MKPFDPRLMKYAKDTRRYIAFLVALGLVMTALIAVQTFLISAIASPVFYGEFDSNQFFYLSMWLAVVFGMRMVVNYVQGAVGHRSAVKVISDLRTKVLRHAGDLGDRWLSKGNTAHVVTLTTRGLDDLEDYFVQFLPQLFLVTTATPALLVVVFYLDAVSAIMIALCIPLVPVFMVLIGKMTAKYSSQRLASMQQLGTQLLDLLAGLATLKGLGREKGPQDRVKSLGDSFARKTMQTLYVAFLSGGALEFITTLTTALVAVSVGLRMVNADILLFEGLVIIMLTPEVLKPLREVGTQFHNSANGVAAAEKAFEILDQPLPKRDGNIPVPDLDHTTIYFDDVSVYAPGRMTVAPANLSAAIPPGQITILRGPSGSGKTTAVQVLLGLLAPSTGHVRIGETPLSDIDIDQWWENITWVPQRPVLVPGTVAENLEATNINDDAIAQASALTGFDQVVSSLPKGWDTLIGQGGTGLSVGQRQRLALTRALLSSRKIVVLDEPSAHLDAVSEEYISNVVRTLKANGHTVIVIAHRSALATLADVVIDVTATQRDITDELAEEQARREIARGLADVSEREMDYALPASWRHTTGTGTSNTRSNTAEEA
ncbi:MAG: thiol reductant ABC exporter subunit CydD [Actinomycetaceae bacterium]|nr:thiol reductant ABC exporter subunit CydD [Actinomycetaceae bacterium]